MLSCSATACAATALSACRPRSPSSPRAATTALRCLLGSRKRYQDYFDSHRGVYWYSPGWIEDGKQPSKERFEETLREYTEKYGADNAEYLRRCRRAG